MRKIITIAVREYRAMVATKAFLASLIMMPLLMLGGIIAMDVLKDFGEIKERKIAVVDFSGEFIDVIENSATLWNTPIINAAEQDQSNSEASETAEEDFLNSGNKNVYLIERIDPAAFSNDDRLEFSAKIKSRELYAWIEIPADVMTQYGASGDAHAGIRYFSQDSGLSEARQWIAAVINNTARTRRLRQLGQEKQINDLSVLVKQAGTPFPVVGLGLVSRGANGKIVEAEEANPIRAIMLPVAVMLLMFMVIFMASQPMLESVLEEKSQRIAEVLLGSANPMQLMSGKLVGTVAGSLTIFAVYSTGACAMAAWKGWTEYIPFELIPWFIVFQILGVLFYAAIFMAIGAAVSQLKEAQSMLLPVWMMLMSPMFIWLFIVRDPLGTVATTFSLFPPATPTTMLLRMATGQSIPLWQPLLGIALTLLATIGIVFVASRIFRVGILWQGKTPRLTEILKWAFSSA